MSGTTGYNGATSDILDEQVDSSAVLVDRLDTWKHAVSIVHSYAQSTLHTQNNISSDLSKQHKIVTEVPNFNGAGVTNNSSSAAGGAGAGRTGSASSAISIAFQSLAKQTQIQLQASEQTASSIKSSIIPQLEILDSDIAKYHKTFKSESHKLSKEVEKHRENTAKHLESLGKAVPAAQSVGQKPDPKNDPYVLHRQVRSVAAEQINKENQQSGSNLTVQNNFGSVEQHIIEVLQNAVASLNELTRRFSQVSLQSSASTEQNFASIQPAQEWALFKNANSSLLVPETGYERDPNKVTFANADAESTVPIIEGSLDRKGTVLKGHKPGYYVLTVSGFLHQFKSADHHVDTHPELSLYIPESEISGLPAATSGDLSFRVVSRDSNKPVSPHHKYTFTAASYEELVAWHTALARVAGSTATSSSLDNVEEDPGIISSPTGSTSAAQAFPTGSETAGLNEPVGGTGTVPGYGSAAGAPSTGLGGIPTTNLAAESGGIPTTKSAGTGGIPSATTAAGGGGFAGAGVASGTPQGLQGDFLPRQQLSESGSGIGQGGPQAFQQQGSVAHGGSVLGGTNPQQSNVTQGVDQLNLGPQQYQSGLQNNVDQFASKPQQFQSNLGGEVNDIRSGPQQFQSGLKNDADQFASGPKQVQSQVGDDVENLKSGPQKAQSGLKNDINQFTSAFK